MGRVEASSRSVISRSMSLAYVVERFVGGHRLDHSQITFCDLTRAIPLCRFLWLLRAVGRCGYTSQTLGDFCCFKSKEGI